MIWKHIFSEFRRFRRLPDKNMSAVFYWKQLKYGKLKLLFSVIEYYITLFVFSDSHIEELSSYGSLVHMKS